MKILYPGICDQTVFECDGTFRNAGGGEEVIWARMLSLLLTEGHEVTTITPHPELFPQPQHPNLKVVTTNQYKIRRTIRKDYIKALYSEFTAGQYDIVVTHAPRLLIWEPEFSSMGPRLIMISHMPTGQLDPRSALRIFPNWIQWVSSGAKYVCVEPPEYYAQHFQQFLNQEKLKENKFYDPTRPIDFSPLLKYYYLDILSYDVPLTQCQSEPACGLFVGRLAKAKMVDFAAKVLVQLSRKTQLPARIYSPSPPSTKSGLILKQVQKIIRGENVKIYIDASRAEITCAYQNAHVLINPSQTECCGGLVPFEAACNGLPVIHSLDSTGGFITGNNAVGTLVRPRSVKNYVKAALEYQTVDTNRRTGQIQRLQTKYKIDRFNQEILKMLTQLSK